MRDERTADSFSIDLGMLGSAERRVEGEPELPSGSLALLGDEDLEALALLGRDRVPALPLLPAGDS